LKGAASVMQREWFETKEASWNDEEQPEFIETVVRHGVGFTFNMVDADEWMNFEKSVRC
jgi:hypothetical protein